MAGAEGLPVGARPDPSNRTQMDLSDHIHWQIRRLCDEGNVLLDRGDAEASLECFTQALRLLPAPAVQWEAYGWIFTAIGDALFSLKRYVEAIQAFCSAAAGDPTPNPFIQLRLGQSYLEAGQPDAAKKALLSAYSAGGLDVFAGDNPKYLDHIRADLPNRN